MMVTRPGLLLRFMGLFFRKVRFDDESVSLIQGLHRDAAVVYVLPSQSLLDYLYFNWAFLKKGLPLAVFGNGMTMWPFRTVLASLKSLWRRVTGRRKPKRDEHVLNAAIEQRQPAVLFLRKARSIFPWWGEFEDDPLHTVVEVQSTAGAKVTLVPLLIVWERAPGQLRPGIVDRVFGDPDAPGRLRKMLNFLGNYRRSLVQVGEPVDVGDFVQQHANLDRRAALGQKLRWALNHRFRLERKVIKGPMLKNAAQMNAEILRLGPFSDRLSELAEAEGRPIDEVRAEAEGYLREIVSDFKLSYIEALCILLTVVFSRIYAGVEFSGEEGVREAAKQAPLVILPSHKSHIDYLLISYVFYINGLVPPHIAAGNNLDFWPLGHVFRRAGAFFLRRSFRRNEVYAETFKTYVHKLLKGGYPVEFFVEGGRSRTGKLLPPKYGLLGHVVDAVMEGHVADLRLCPAALGYEKIVEGDAYTRELSGAKKEKENLGQLFGATRVLTERFGRVYVNFPEPLSLREFLLSNGIDPEYGFTGEVQRRQIIKKLGYRVLCGINEAAVANASSVVALALLGNPRRGISRRFLLRRVGAVIDYMLHCGAPLASGLKTPLQANRVALERQRTKEVSSHAAALAAFDGDGELAMAYGETLGHVVDETVALFAKAKHMTVTEYGDDEGAVYQVPPDRRVELDYYKNNIVHLFVRESILAATLLRCWREGDLWGDRLRVETEFLSRLLKLEYIFEQGANFDEQYQKSLRAFEEADLLQANRAARIVLPVPGQRTLRLLANLTLPVVEGYYVVARSLCEMPEAMAEPQLLSTIHAFGDRLWREGELTFKEALSSVTFQNAMEWFKGEGLVTFEHRDVPRKRRRPRSVKFVVPTDKLLANTDDTVQFADRLGRFLIPFG